MPMERTASVEDMVGNLWRLGRTPSQAEFETFFSNIAQVGSQGNLMAQAAAAQAAQAAQPETNGTDAAASGIPRVASIDLLRKMIMQGQQPAVAPAMVPNLMNPMAGMGAMQPGIAGAGLGAAGMIPGMGVAGINPAALAAAGIPQNVAPASPKVDKKPPKNAKAAPKGKAAAKGKTSPAATKKGVKREASLDPSSKASDDDFSDDDDLGDGKGGKTTDEVRRQRRMLSNRESARRSRRRKLEHVSVLEGQINGHKAENIALLERLRESEARVEAVVRENAQLKAEIVRMSEVGGGASGKPMERASSLQRIASAGNLAKSNLGGTASPQMSGDDSPRGFVPFRSLQSYENLLSLQAQGR